MNNTAEAFADKTLQQAKRNPFWLVSVLLHLALLVPLYYWQVSMPEEKKQATKKAQARQLAEKAFISSIEEHSQKIDDYRREAEQLAKEAITNTELKMLAEAQKQQLQQISEAQKTEQNTAPSPLDDFKTPRELIGTADYIHNLQVLTEAQKLLENSDINPSEALQMTEYNDLSELSAPTVETLAELQRVTSISSQNAREALQQMQQQVQNSQSGASITFGTGGGQGGASPGGLKGNGITRGNMLYSSGGGVSLTGRDLNFYNESAPKQINNSFTTQGGQTGNVLGLQGNKTDKVFIDTWYMIGPFQHSRSDDRQRAWPPEARINLDDHFVGKNGQLVTWQYYKSPKYPLEPPKIEDYTTWYGYTEVYLEHPRQLWVNAGCDDYCKIWLNNELAWESGDYQKPWYTDGGYYALTNRLNTWSLSEDKRLMQFKKGRNSLMFRLDNGYGHMFMSLVLSGD